MSCLVKSGGLKLTQGAVLDDVPWNLCPKPYSIVLTNPCDVENGKASFIIVAAMLSARDTIRASSEFRNRTDPATDHTLTRKQWDSLRVFLTSYVHNTDIRRYFFIDAQCLDVDPLVVDYQLLMSMSWPQAQKCRLLARLPSPYVEQMIMHFASYASRIGADRISEDHARELTDFLAQPFRGPQA